jgi:NAD/NADP transhydrogenase alpha subunit
MPTVEEDLERVGFAMVVEVGVGSLAVIKTSRWTAAG